MLRLGSAEICGWCSALGSLRIRAPAFVVILAAWTVGCSRGEQERERAAPVRVGYIPIADCGQLMVADHLALFAREGIRVELVSLPGGARILEAMNAGSVHIGFTNLLSLLLARSQGLDYVSITGGPFEDSTHTEHAILVRGTGIRSVAELRGRRIALNTRRNIDELMVRQLLARNGVDSSDVEFLEIPFPRMLPVLEAGQVDASAAIEPFVTAGRLNPRLRVLSYNYVALQPSTQISTYVAHRQWLAANREAARRFVRAIEAATDSIAANPALLRAALAQFTSLPDSILRVVTLPAFTKEMDRRSLLQLLELARQHGFTAAPDSTAIAASYSWP